MTRCVALLVAGGQGERAGGGIPKQYQSLAGESVLRRAVRVFVDHPGVDAVRVVIRQADRALYDGATAGLDLLEPVPGGATRQESALRGLESLTVLDPKIVIIHDAARPLCHPDVLTRVIAALSSTQAAVPCVPVRDTLKRGASAGAVVAATVERKHLWQAQTPQGFHFQDILAAHRQKAGQALTDDAAVAEQAGIAVNIVEGDEDNIKITTAGDFSRAARWLGAGGETRTGFGFDVHRFGPGNHVTLGGIAIVHDQGLVGHSDADVVLHALTDAVLGAVGAGDIGQHFPPSDPQWRGSDSEIFLKRGVQLVAEAHGRIINVDITVICERPKIGPHREAMVGRIARILAIEPARVSVKATTSEGLGFTGRREGIAAQAIATVQVNTGCS
jgi:2-C-methyl-D-erythritol 4-phosphate cytidylyltransferase / 2-C-methyl-D-erythritol 2,4-cyclodiphosphate synthase